MKLVEATAIGAIEEARTLFREYELSQGLDLCFQDFEAELTSLPGKYAPPRGRLFLATEADAIIGCIALRPISADVSEMKRLYVRPEFRGRGVGRVLVERLIECARRISYRIMRLDTIGSRMPEARALYTAVGFKLIPAYYENPIEGVEYMELDLRPGER